jgi:phenylpyruvate tautomerase PptA (4-oxalocrotonate tautomerase family)
MRAHPTEESPLPNIVVRVPKGSFPGDQRAALIAALTRVATSVEQMPEDPAKQFVTWVVVEEIEAGSWGCGGADVTAKMLPCMVQVFVPAGVLDEPARARYAELLHAALRASLPGHDKRMLVTSIIVGDVSDGSWAANGAIWRLPDLAKAAGYRHLQHLVRS